MKQLFKIKTRNPHPVCVVYEEVLICEQMYIGETGRKIKLRWEEHENIDFEHFGRKLKPQV